MACCLTLLLIFENGGETTLQFPGLEERRPVDIARQLFKIVALECLGTDKLRLDRLVARPIHLLRVFARTRQRQALLFAFIARMRIGNLGIFGANAVNIGWLLVFRQKC